MISLSYAVFSTDKTKSPLVAFDHQKPMNEADVSRNGDDVIIGGQFVLVGCLKGFNSADLVSINESKDVMKEWKI